MKLTLEQIQSVTFGAAKVWAENGSIYFRRFSDSQIETFIGINPEFDRRVYTTAGCRLDLHTDSRHLMLVPAVNCKYDVLIDGLHALFLDNTDRVILPLPEGDTRVTILLSNHNPAGLKIVFLDEGSYVRPHTYDKKFLFLGDSITQGTRSSRPSLQYVNRISQYYNAQVLNWGVGGSHFHPDTLEPVDYDPDVIFIAYGTNDYVHHGSIDTIRQLSSAYMDKVNALFPNKKVFCISPLWRTDGEVVRATGNHRQVCDLVRKQALDHGFTHIEGYDLVPHMPEFFDDGYLHPNDLGFSMYAQNLIRELTRLGLE